MQTEETSHPSKVYRFRLALLHLLLPLLAINSSLELDTLHVDVSPTYLKISGVLGLGGGSVAYGTFGRNEEGRTMEPEEGERADC